MKKNCRDTNKSLFIPYAFKDKNALCDFTTFPPSRPTVLNCLASLGIALNHRHHHEKAWHC